MITEHLPDELSIDVMPLRLGAHIFRAINHPLRQQMLLLIHQHQRLTVTEVYVQLQLEQSPASQHLAILRKAQLVKTEKKGKFIYYSVNYEQLNLVHACTVSLLAK